MAIVIGRLAMCRCWRGEKLSLRVERFCYGGEKIPGRSTLTVVLRTISKMDTDNMGLFILPLTRPCIRAQTVPQNISKEKPKKKIT